MVSGISGSNNWNIGNMGAADDIKAPKSAAAGQAKASNIAADSFEKESAGTAGNKIALSLPAFSGSQSTTAVALPKPRDRYDLGVTIKGLRPEVKESSAWQKLPIARREELMASEGFTTLGAGAQKEVLALAGRLSDAALKDTLLLLESSAKLPREVREKLAATMNKAPLAISLPADKNAIRLDAKSAEAPLAKPLMALINNPDFVNATADTQLAVIAQCYNAPNASSVKSLLKLTGLSWFKNMSLPDQQRAAKSIAYLAEVGASNPASMQERIINNTLNRLFSGSIDIAYESISDDFGQTTYGYAMTSGDKKGITFNRAIIPAGNGPFPKKDKDACFGVLQTFPHEVNHMVNGDENRATYKYFQAEYRAWYVGFIAQHGREPTKQEAFDRCVSIFDAYKPINYALVNIPEESKKIIDFMNQMFLVDIHPESQTGRILTNTLMGLMTVPSFFGISPVGQGPAPMPDMSLKPDLDN